MVDGGPREPRPRQLDRRRGESSERQPACGGEGGVPRARPVDRPTVARCRSTPRCGRRRRGHRGRRRWRAALAGTTNRRARRWRRGRRRVRTSTAAGPSRRAPRRRRRRRRCRRHASPPRRPGPPAAPRRDDAVGAPAGALLGHHRAARVVRAHAGSLMARRPQPTADGTREKWVCTPKPRRRGRRSPQHHRGPPRSGNVSCRRRRCPRSPTAPRRRPGSDPPRRSRRARRRGTSNPSIAGQTLRHCSASRSSRPWTTSGVRAEGDDVGVERRRAATPCRRRRPRRPTRGSTRHGGSMGSASEGSCILDEESIQYTKRRQGRRRRRRRHPGKGRRR